MHEEIKSRFQGMPAAILCRMFYVTLCYLKYKDRHTYYFKVVCCFLWVLDVVPRIKGEHGLRALEKSVLKLRPKSEEVGGDWGKVI